MTLILDDNGKFVNKIEENKIKKRGRPRKDEINNHLDTNKMVINSDNPMLSFSSFVTVLRTKYNDISSIANSLNEIAWFLESMENKGIV